MSNNYSKAYTEVLEIIRHFSKEEYSKIPKEKIEFYKENMDKNYNFKIDPTIDLAEQNISREANAIIVLLYRDYFATEQQKIILKEILEMNQRLAEEEKRKKYNPDNIFKKDKENIECKNEEIQLVEYKETFFSRFKKFIFKILHINY